VPVEDQVLTLEDRDWSVPLRRPRPPAVDHRAERVASDREPGAFEYGVRGERQRGRRRVRVARVVDRPDVEAVEAGHRPLHQGHHVRPDAVLTGDRDPVLDLPPVERPAVADDDAVVVPAAPLDAHDRARDGCRPVHDLRLGEEVAGGKRHAGRRRVFRAPVVDGPNGERVPTRPERGRGAIGLRQDKHAVGSDHPDPRERIPPRLEANDLAVRVRAGPAETDLERRRVAAVGEEFEGRVGCEILSRRGGVLLPAPGEDSDQDHRRKGGQGGQSAYRLHGLSLLSARDGPPVPACRRRTGTPGRGATSQRITASNRCQV
jgi:hypothetical protein